MEDSKIIELFNARSEQGISILAQKYGSRLKRIALNITKNEHDAEECVNDAYLKLWNLIPPNTPKLLSVYAGKIVRTTAIDAMRIQNAHKRGGNADVDFDEIDNYMGEYSIDDLVSKKELACAISDFLRTLSPSDRVMFMRRYYYCESVSDIAKNVSKTPHNVTVKLARIKEKLKQYLMTKGILV